MQTLFDALLLTCLYSFLTFAFELIDLLYLLSRRIKGEGVIE